MKTCPESEGSRGDARKLRRPVDLIGRPVLTGGARGEQLEFLDKENFLTLSERERINAKRDIEGQMKLC